MLNYDIPSLIINLINKMKKDKDVTFIRLSFLSGLISGAINKFLTHPIDTIKAKVQISQIEFNSLSNIQKNGLRETTLRIYRTEGVRGYFRGVVIACVC